MKRSLALLLVALVACAPFIVRASGGADDGNSRRQGTDTHSGDDQANNSEPGDQGNVPGSNNVGTDGQGLDPTFKEGSHGDPVFSGFDGSTLEFVGEPYTYWNVLTERLHNVNAFLTPALEEGSYITSFGIKYDIHELAVGVLEDGSLAVHLNGQQLALGPNENGMTMRLANRAAPSTGNVTVTWEKRHPEFGHCVEVRTPTLAFVAYSVAPGTIDLGDVVQPAFLDSRVTLVGPPAGNRLGGILGASYQRLINSIMGKPAPAGRLMLDPAAMGGLRASGPFDTSFPGSLFGAYESASAASHRRLLA